MVYLIPLNNPEEMDQLGFSWPFAMLQCFLVSEHRNF